MKLTWFLLFSICINHFTFSQIDMKVNRIFIWDVTLSMQGFGGSEDIWDEVKKRMIQNIQQIPDDDGVLTILPFQEDIVNPVFTNETTEEGKKEAIDFIKKFDTNNPTYTNICKAWERAVSYIDNNKLNLVYLFTDGKQNAPNSGYREDCMSDLASDWCELANRTRSCYGVYVALTDSAALRGHLREIICEDCPDFLICGDNPNIVNIRPKHPNIYVSIREDSYFDLSFYVTGTLPDQFTYQLNLQDNPIIEIDEKIEYQMSRGYNTRVAFKQNSTQTGEGDYEIKLSISCNKDYPNSIIHFAPSYVTLKISIQPLKTLTIKVKDEQ